MNFNQFGVPVKLSDYMGRQVIYIAKKQNVGALINWQPLNIYIDSESDQIIQPRRLNVDKDLNMTKNCRSSDVEIRESKFSSTALIHAQHNLLQVDSLSTSKPSHSLHTKTFLWVSAINPNANAREVDEEQENVSSKVNE